MCRLPDLRVLARLLVRLLPWLDDNFERIFKSLREQLPDASDVWLADMIVNSAIEGTFKTIKAGE